MGGMHWALPPQSKAPISKRTRPELLRMLSSIRGGMKLHVKTLQGKTITVEVEPDETVADLKVRRR
jgi:hypothetical protein